MYKYVILIVYLQRNFKKLIKYKKYSLKFVPHLYII